MSEDSEWRKIWVDAMTMATAARVLKQIEENQDRQNSIAERLLKIKAAIWATDNPPWIDNRPETK